MESEPKKIGLKLDIGISEEILDALIEYRSKGGFPNFDEAVAAILDERLGKSSGGPTWTDSDILALHESGKKILRVLCMHGAMESKEIAQKADMSPGEFRANLAHLSRAYKHGKEPLHVWNKSKKKYEVNPKYLDMLKRLLVT